MTNPNKLYDTQECLVPRYYAPVLVLGICLELNINQNMSIIIYMEAEEDVILGPG